jgi:hypothetical protein
MHNSGSIAGLSVQIVARGENCQVYSSIIQRTGHWCLITSMALETMPNVHLTRGGICMSVQARGWERVILCSSLRTVRLTVTEWPRCGSYTEA